MINEDILGGRTKKEFVDFMSDMLIEDNTLANDILRRYFSEETPECWNFRTNIIVEWYGKKQKLKKQKHGNN
jgi:hypothetical protein